MGRALEAIAHQARDRYVVVGRVIWGICRVNSDDLRQVGYAALEGSAAGRAAAAEITATRRQAQDLAAGATPDQVKAHEAELQAQLRAIVEKRNAAMTSTVEGEKALTARLDGYILAAVERCGILRSDVQYPPLHVLDDDVNPSTIAKDLRSPEEIAAGVDPMFWEKVSIVRTEEEADPAAGRLWLHSLSAEDRRALGMIIAQLQGASALAEVTPFRDAADAGAPVAVDADVPRAAAPRVPGAHAVPDGDRGRGDGARKGVRSKATGGSQDGVPRRHGR